MCTTRNSRHVCALTHPAVVTVSVCSCSCGAACRVLTCSSLWDSPADRRHQPRQQFEIICLFSFMEYFVCNAAFKSLKHKLREKNNRAEQWSGGGHEVPSPGCTYPRFVFFRKERPRATPGEHGLVCPPCPALSLSISCVILSHSLLSLFAACHHLVKEIFIIPERLAVRHHRLSGTLYPHWV